MKFFFVFCALLFSFAANASDCLVDGSEVELTGKVWRETFPGPPNYSSIAEGDEPQTFWILTTEKAYCGKAYSMESGNLYRISGQMKRFQLVLTSKEYKDNQSLVFNRAKVVGQLFAGHTGHHKTKMLIQVKSLNPAPE